MNAPSAVSSNRVPAPPDDGQSAFAVNSQHSGGGGQNFAATLDRASAKPVRKSADHKPKEAQSGGEPMPGIGNVPPPINATAAPGSSTMAPAVSGAGAGPAADSGAMAGRAAGAVGDPPAEAGASAGQNTVDQAGQFLGSLPGMPDAALPVPSVFVKDVAAPGISAPAAAGPGLDAVDGANPQPSDPMPSPGAGMSKAGDAPAPGSAAGPRGSSAQIAADTSRPADGVGAARDATGAAPGGTAAAGASWAGAASADASADASAGAAASAQGIAVGAQAASDSAAATAAATQSFANAPNYAAMLDGAAPPAAGQAGPAGIGGAANPHGPSAATAAGHTGTAAVPGLSALADAGATGKHSGGNGDPLPARADGDAALSAAQAAGSPVAAPDTTAVPTLKVSAALDSSEFAGGLAERVSYLVDNNLNGAKLQVNPPQLGPIEVRIAIQGDHAQVWLTSHSAVTRDALESSSPKLREMLGAQGFGQVSVDISQRSFQERSTAQQPYDWAPSARSSASAAPAAVPASAVPIGRAANAMLDAYA